MSTAKQWNHAGDNVKYTVEGDKLTVEIDISKDFGESKSGKTITVASTRGNTSVHGRSGTVTMGVNVYKAKRD